MYITGQGTKDVMGRIKMKQNDGEEGDRLRRSVLQPNSVKLKFVNSSPSTLVEVTKCLVLLP